MMLLELPPLSLYVHMPWCVRKCPYCDFNSHAAPDLIPQARYVDALLEDLAIELPALQGRALTSVFFGGGTPSLFAPEEVGRFLERARRLVPFADDVEVTLEANPGTIEHGRFGGYRDAGVNRVSLGAQSFASRLLEVLERRAGPDDVRRAFYHLRDACCDNISIDLIYGIPGQSPSDLERDLAEARALSPEHISCYELEAKPGTRFTHAWGEELAGQAEAMEGYFELVVETLVDAGYRWYETANFCRDGRQARHNLAYWHGRDYLGVGIGAVSTVGHTRWRNAPKLAAYVTALAEGTRPPREVEELDERTKVVERLMLGLRLDEPLGFDDVEAAVDGRALERLAGLGLVSHSGGALTLTRAGRFLGGGVTAELLSEIPAKQYN
jgi:putative oxygen-independent coproporphyrinogen III oxidase